MRRSGLVILLCKALWLITPLAAIGTELDCVAQSPVVALKPASQSTDATRYEVVSGYGAKGDGQSDDTAAIQAAFDACWAAGTGVQPYGGTVHFEGNRSYVISKTINAYDTCQIEGGVGSTSAQALPLILWNGPTVGQVYTLASFTASQNRDLYIPSSPHGKTNAARAPAQPFAISASVDNTLNIGDWLLFQNCQTSAGAELNNVVAQVGQASGSSLTVTFGGVMPHLGTLKDSGCTATTINVGIAFDSWARTQQTVRDLTISNKPKVPVESWMGVDLYFGSRVDSGTEITNTWADHALYADYYFSDGGIDVDLDHGWRSDGTAMLGNVYWRIGGQDSFSMSNGSLSANAGVSGPYLTLDNQACVKDGNVHLAQWNMRYEVDVSFVKGTGAMMLLDCSSNPAPQFFLTGQNTYVAVAGLGNNGLNAPSIVMSPPNDSALNLSMLNAQFARGTGGNPTVPFAGLPTLERYDITGDSGYIPQLNYAPSTRSMGSTGGLKTAAASTQLLGDLNIEQLWEYGVKAAVILYSDRDFKAFPNGTTLFKGQLIAPAPSKGTETSALSLALVTASGTTGSPNAGQTVCTTGKDLYQATCSSATDLSPGQHVSFGLNNDEVIAYIDARDSAAVIVHFLSRLETPIATADVLTFCSPTIGQDSQLISRMATAPATGTWMRGDMVTNTQATAGGKAAWICIEAGSPGKWVAIAAERGP